MIVGPTASGKSALALELAKKQARHADAVIINADSAQVYSDLQILSARPTEQEMDGIEHQLYGYIDGSEACSAARWANDAKTSIDTAHDRDMLPILVGGTGLYIRTLLEGIAPIPEIDPNIRTEIRALEILEAYQLLMESDPVSAERLAPTDKTRIQRALEVVQSTGKPLNFWHQKKVGGIGEEIALHPLILLPPREWLYERCDVRFEQMLEMGAREEVESLLSRNLGKDLPVMRAIGIREVSAWLDGSIEREAAVAQAQTATRQYAKRQYTWFRNQCPAEWRRREETDYNDIDNYFEILLRQ